MSTSAALQKAIHDVLKASSAIPAVEGRIFDDVPKDAAFPYVSFGPSDVVEDGSDCIASGEHTLQIDVWSRTVGKVEARRIVDGIKTALHERELTLEDGALVDIRVGFRQVVEDPDGLTSHGIVRVTAIIEEGE